MTQHLLDAIEELKADKTTDKDELLTKWKEAFELQPWGTILEAEDWSKLVDRCNKWMEFKKMVLALEPKYKQLWNLAGQPPTYEEWHRTTTRHNVDHRYWKLYNTPPNQLTKKGMVQ